MKKGIAILIAVLAAIGIIIGIISGSYNRLVNQQEEVENKQSVISVQLQRRADLIPNFVNTVKGYSDYEQKTYTAVTEARNAVAGAKTAGEQTKAAEQLDSAISVWVNAVTEAYPELKANENYKALQVEDVYKRQLFTRSYRNRNHRRGGFDFGKARLCARCDRIGGIYCRNLHNVNNKYTIGKPYI